MIPAGQGQPWATTVLSVLLGLEIWHLLRVELDRDVDGYRTWLLDTLRGTFTSTANT